MNTSRLDDLQINWLIEELILAQKYYWIIVVGFASLTQLNLHGNFTQMFMDYHTNMYVHYGDFYVSSAISYPLDDHSHNHFKDTSQLVIIQQGPSWIENNELTASNNSIYATTQPGYGIITSKYSTLLWQEFNSKTHHLINQVTQYRIDLSPRKEDEIKNFKVIFVLTFLIFLSAFLQVFVQKELEKRRLSTHKPLESGIIDY